MKPELAQYESANKKVSVVKINIDERDGEKWKKYKEYMTAEAIPYTVVLDKKGKVVADFVGFKDAAQLKAVVDSTNK